MVKPIKPDEAVAAKVFPDEVITAFNELITENLSGKVSRFKQEDVIARIRLKTDVERREIFDNRWLDVEDLYRSEGWKVEYDSPAYNENYPAIFTFTR